MYIHKASSYITDAGVPVAQLKQDLIKHKKSVIRRINRFILLALIGAHKCVGDALVDPIASIYVTTENGNLADTESILSTIHIDNELPMPFGFVNTMSNTAAFYVAQSLMLSGKNITMSCKHLSFERGLELLRLDIKTGSVTHALICGVDETDVVDGPISDSKINKEGSGWLYITRDDDNAKGRVLDIQSFYNKEEALQWAGSLANDKFILAFGKQVTAAEKTAWRNAVDYGEEYNYLAECGSFNSITSCGIAGFIENFSRATMLHINRDEYGRYMALIVERF